MFQRLRLLVRRIWAHKAIQWLTYLVVTYVFYNAIGGIVGNTVYTGSFPTWLPVIFKQLSGFVVVNILIIVSFIAITSLIGLCYLWYRHKNAKTALTVTDSLAELDNSAMRLLSGLLSCYTSKSKQVFQKETRRLLHELLRDATRTVLGDQNLGRAAIFAPAIPPDDQYLRIIAYHRLPSSAIDRTKFYIGNDDDKDTERGTVGMTYSEGLQHLSNPQQAIRIGHLTQKDGFIECDDEYFINFDESRARLPYNTFANIPIIGLSKDGKETCLGVLCFDSRISNGFDAPRTKPLLNEIVIRVGAVLSIYMEIVRSHYQSEAYFEDI